MCGCTPGTRMCTHRYRYINLYLFIFIFKCGVYHIKCTYFLNQINLLPSTVFYTSMI